MVDEEVEIVLREIRERVISQARAEQIASASTPADGNGDNRYEDETSSAAELARINGYLTTTARAWDRLPPVTSNRLGAVSRLELWLKFRAKSLARWFTWEQVNFNAAVHHAIRDTLDALSHQQAAIASLRRDAETRQIEFAEATAHLAELSAKVDALAAESETRRIDFQNQRTEINTLRAELRGESEARRIQIEDTLQAAIQTELRQQSARLSELANELRERANEQRVSFKQLSLENSEAATFQNTSWRKIESALAELDQRLKELEASTKRSK
ncbi:MAG TPA: hypothetical protein VEL78_07800 [Pyrinomonadaceae bacterium]|nr:hypothetical protein [Pyrinomonadaceae bacterium]